jgi:hypothetical protein
LSKNCQKVVKKLSQKVVKKLNFNQVKVGAKVATLSHLVKSCGSKAKGQIKKVKGRRPKVEKGRKKDM